uniref:hypothetical protein n=1 Tax=Flagellimonas flava TaxID=570519 RepID=UPI003D660E82
GNSVDLSGYVNTDAQTLSLSGTDLSISGGNTVDISSIDTDTDDQTLSLTGNTLAIADGNSVDLSGYVNTDAQTLSLSGTDLSISGGNTVDISSIDTDTDDQTLSLSGTDLTIVDGNTVDISSINTDGQTLGLSGTNLSISGGNTIDISSIDTDTDDQTLSLSGTNLSIVDGNTIDISSIDTDTDDQTVDSFTFNSGTGELAISLQDDGAAPVTVDISAVSTDDQNASEVDLVTPVDMDEAGEASPTNETTVEEAIQAIAPITSKAARIFYPPSIAVPASSVGAATPIDLHAQYVAQYGSPAVSNPSAPSAIPTYAANELHYYITYYDTSVFSGVSISDAGVMSYTVDAVPTGYNSLINVVFVVK